MERMIHMLDSHITVTLSLRFSVTTCHVFAFVSVMGWYTSFTGFGDAAPGVSVVIRLRSFNRNRRESTLHTVEQQTRSGLVREISIRRHRHPYARSPLQNRGLELPGDGWWKAELATLCIFPCLHIYRHTNYLNSCFRHVMCLIEMTGFKSRWCQLC